MSQFCLRPTSADGDAFGLSRRLIVAVHPATQSSGHLWHVRGSLESAEANRRQARHIRNCILVLLAVVTTSISGVAQLGVFGQQSVGTTSGMQNVTVMARSAGTAVTVEVLTLGVEGLDFAPGTSEITCVSATLGVGSACTESVTFTPRFPGLRTGAVVLLDSNGVVLGTTYLSGTGIGGLGILALGNVCAVAGNGSYEGPVGDGNVATSASLNQPSSVTIDGAGNMYIADRYHNRVRKVASSNDVASTLAGSGVAAFAGDGLPSTDPEVSVNTPSGVALDGAGNLYIADTGNNRIRKIELATGTITTVAGDGSPGNSNGGLVGDNGLATSASLNQPQGVTVDAGGNLYIADTLNHRIRRVDALTGIITTVAGDGYTDPVTGVGGYAGDKGQATNARLNFPFAVAFDPSGNMYIPDSSNNVVRMVNKLGVISTFAGTGSLGHGGDGGPATAATLFSPLSVVADPAGNVYIADTQNERIRKVSSVTGIISTFSDYWVSEYTTPTLLPFDGGFYEPTGLFFDGSGNLYFADSLSMKVREIQSNFAILDYIPTAVRQGDQSAQQNQTIENDGNAPFDLTSITPDKNAAVDGAATTCTTGSTQLKVNTDCVIAGIFAPSSAGYPLFGNVYIAGNNVNSPLDIELIGDATAVSSTTITLASTVNPSGFGVAVTLIASATTGAGTGNLTGSVTFTDGTVTLGTSVPVNSSGVATFKTSALSVGVHQITASYGGDKTHSDSTSTTLNQTVLENTSTTLISSANPLAVGQSITFTATVTISGGGGLTPDGSVTFSDGSTILASASLNASGVATYTSATLTNGMHTITATYNGDSANQISGSVSNVLKQDVLEASLVVLTSTPNPSNYGNTVIVTITVNSSGAASPTGSVIILDGGKQIGIANLVGSTGSGTFSTSSLAVGSHTITAAYQGDTNNGPNSSGSITQLVNQAQTTVALAATPSPAIVGGALSISATVQVVRGAATPSGELTFTDTFDGTTVALGTKPLGAGGTVAINPTLALGTHSVVASYVGDADDGASASAPVVIKVQLATTSTAVSSSESPSVIETAVTFTAKVTGNGGTPAGAAIFFADGILLGSSTLDAGGRATLSYSALTVGTHSITAMYTGDANDQASTSPPISQVVGTISTATSLGASSTTAPAAQLVLIAMVTGSAGPTPTGTVTFSEGQTILGSISLSSDGVATLTPALAAGTYSVIASYGGDLLHSPSVSAAVSVSSAGSSFTLGVTPNTVNVATTESATITVNLASIGGFTDTISLGCLGLPSGVNCHFSSVDVTVPEGGSKTAQLTIDTNNPLGGGASAMNRRSGKRDFELAALFLPFNLVFGWLFRRYRKYQNSILSAVLVVILTGVALLATGCGGTTQGSAEPGTYSIQVAGAGTSSHMTVYQTVTLNITR
jgi:sugar lactone lactonase YvrE